MLITARSHNPTSREPSSSLPPSRRVPTGGIPPLRFFIGSVLYAVMVIYIENASHISAGGVSALSISIARLAHLPVGLMNLAIKFAIFALIGVLSGRRTAVWTMVSAVLSALCMAVFEHYPLPFVWPQWLAFLVIVTVAYLPVGLMLSKGYSTGGFTAVAQALWQRRGIPIWVTMTAMNGVAIIAMGVTFGKLSGILTLVATLWGGFSIQLWTRWTSLWLDGRASDAA